MPLESCPKCGYALSIQESVCRHCPVALTAGLKATSMNAKAIYVTIFALVGGGFLYYGVLHFVK